MKEKEQPHENSQQGAGFPVDTLVTAEQEKRLQDMWRAAAQGNNQHEFSQAHILDALLYDLALGNLNPEEQQEASAHLASCDYCRDQLGELHDAIAKEKEVGAMWAPTVLHAAGGAQELSVIKEATAGGKYEITLQPLRDRQEDLLTLEVMASYKDQLEDQEVLIVSREGNCIVQGTIAGGTITRRVDRKFRHEWPFYVHAG